MRGQEPPRFTEPQNALGWKGAWKVMWFQPPAVSRDIFSQTRLLRAPSNLALTVPSDGASTTSLGSLCQGFPTLTAMNFFLTSSLKLRSLSLKPLPLVLSQQALLKSCPHLSYQPPFCTERPSTLCKRLHSAPVFFPALTRWATESPAPGQTLAEELQIRHLRRMAVIRGKGEQQHGQAKHRFSVNRIFSVPGQGKTQQEPIPAAGAGPGIAGQAREPESDFLGQRSITDTRDAPLDPFYSQHSSSSGHLGDAQGAIPPGLCGRGAAEPAHKPRHRQHCVGATQRSTCSPAKGLRCAWGTQRAGESKISRRSLGHFSPPFQSLLCRDELQLLLCPRVTHREQDKWVRAGGGPVAV